MELKNTAWELREANTSFNSWIDQAKESMSEIEDQLNEVKKEGKTREKKWKEINKASKKYGIMCKYLIYTISVSEYDKKNESKLENMLQEIFPSLARQSNIQIQEI